MTPLATFVSEEGPTMKLYAEIMMEDLLRILHLKLLDLYEIKYSVRQLNLDILPNSS
jgi:hypothetical protein